MKKQFILIPFICTAAWAQAQVLGGGQFFSTSVVFSSSLTSGCPGAGTSLSNQVAFEPNTPLDPCGAPAPACATGNTGSDVWFSFYAHTSTASIVAAPSSSLDIAIQAFSGTSCPTLSDIGCVDANGNNASETLHLTGLNPGEQYYFRIFGATNTASNRTGTYHFCGSSGLESAPLPSEISSFMAREENGSIMLNWYTESESNNDYFEIQKSRNGTDFTPIGTIKGAGNSAQRIHYSFTDNTASFPENFYRLRQVDFDGKSVFSSIAIATHNTTKQEALSIFPNPASDRFSIDTGIQSGESCTVLITDAMGREIYHRQQNILSGLIEIQVDQMGNIRSGVFIIRCITSSGERSARFHLVR